MRLRGPGSVPPRPGRCGCGTGPLCAAAAFAAVRTPPAALAANRSRREIGFMDRLLFKDTLDGVGEVCHATKMPGRRGELRTRPQGRIESLPHPNGPGTLSANIAGFQ